MKYLYWRCSGCNVLQRGVKDKNDDFISDKEVESGRPKRFWASGCPICGCPVGDWGDHVDDEETEE